MEVMDGVLAMVLASLLASAPSSPAPAPTSSPTLPPPRPSAAPPPSASALDTSWIRLRVPPFAFTGPTTLRILGQGRFGTWSLLGSTLGQRACALVPNGRCLEIATAWLGLSWRPLGSPMSLYVAAGIDSTTMLPTSMLPGSTLQPMIGRASVGLTIDLPSPRHPRRPR